MEDQHNLNGSYRPTGDPLMDKLNELVAAVREIGRDQKAFNMNVVRWLLIVVCTVALGNKALEVGDKALDVMKKTAVEAQQ